MKETAITLIGVIIAVIGLHAFKSSQTSSVTGRMNFEDRGSRIVARQGNDSVQTLVSADGTFRILLTKGRWQLEVERYTDRKLIQNYVIDSMTIGETDDIDLGRISSGL